MADLLAGGKAEVARRLEADRLWAELERNRRDLAEIRAAALVVGDLGAVSEADQEILRLDALLARRRGARA